jgi:hypothetical protein
MLNKTEVFLRIVSVVILALLAAAGRIVLLSDDGRESPRTTLDEIEAPTGEEVEAYFKANIDDYTPPTTVTYAHLYFNTDKRAEAAEYDARRVRDKLNAAGEITDAHLEEGDLFLLGNVFLHQTKIDVVKKFGAGELTDRLFEVEIARWHGPVPSGFGVHLVYVFERIEVNPPELDALRERVQNDLMDSRRREAVRAANDAFRERLGKSLGIGLNLNDLSKMIFGE